MDRLTAQSSPGNAAVSKVRRQADALAPMVGTRAVTGPGLKVTLDDAHRTAASLPEGFTADDIVVHQQDVQSVVNALWAGGAEGMMLQDQRVISTSAVRCVGNTLILQGRVYSPPYVITAVGDVQGMRQQLETDPSVTIYRQYADLLGLRYDVEDTAQGHPARLRRQPGPRARPSREVSLVRRVHAGSVGRTCVPAPARSVACPSSTPQ